MEFKIFDTEEGEREVGNYERCENYEHMYDCANNDVWKLLQIVEWVKLLDEDVVLHAIRTLRLKGHNKEANHLELWLKGKPE